MKLVAWMHDWGTARGMETHLGSVSDQAETQNTATMQNPKTSKPSRSHFKAMHVFLS